uniref:Uncharacterized protein n=1 Tax=Arundo donax TaxID=35708 RepID=A0A0A9HXT0_ARUDO
MVSKLRFLAISMSANVATDE